MSAAEAERAEKEARLYVLQHANRLNQTSKWVGRYKQAIAHERAQKPAPPWADTAVASQPVAALSRYSRLPAIEAHDIVPQGWKNVWHSTIACCKCSHDTAPGKRHACVYCPLVAHRKCVPKPAMTVHQLERVMASSIHASVRSNNAAPFHPEYGQPTFKPPPPQRARHELDRDSSWVCDSCAEDVDANRSIIQQGQDHEEYVRRANLAASYVQVAPPPPLPPTRTPDARRPPPRAARRRRLRACIAPQAAHSARPRVL
jgi:hypothetical protein